MVCWCLFCDRFWGATRSFTVVVVGGGYQYDSSMIGCLMSCFQFGTGEDYTFIFGAWNCDYVWYSVLPYPARVGGSCRYDTPRVGNLHITVDSYGQFGLYDIGASRL